MMEYLRNDPVANDDLRVLCFICRNWHILEQTINSKATIDTIKRQLMSLGIRYIQRTPDMNWHYWNDYTPLGMMEFYPMPKEQLDTPAEYPSAENTPSRSVADTDEEHAMMAMSPPRVERTPIDEPDQMDMTEYTSQERMPFAPSRHSTSPSGEVALPIDSCTTGSYPSTEESSTEDEVIYIRTQKPVQESDTSEDEGQKPSALVKQRSIPKPLVTYDDDEGFTPVSTRQNRKYRRSQKPTMLIIETTAPVSQFQRNPALENPTTTARIPSPPEEIHLTQRDEEYSNMDDPIHLPVQMDTLTEIPER